jgi:hypothetical protein
MPRKLGEKNVSTLTRKGILTATLLIAMASTAIAGTVEKIFQDHFPTAVSAIRMAPADRTNFLTGKEFVVAEMSARYAGRDTESFNSAAVDLMMLIETTAGENENAELRDLLSGMLRRNINSTALSAGIRAIMAKYAERQPADQKWHVLTGAAATNAVYSAFYSDASSLSRHLSEIKICARMRPSSLDPVLVQALSGLAMRASDEGYSHSEMEAIKEQGLKLFELIEA